MSRPRPITGSAGSRIRVILGETGSDYLYYLNEDNGNTEWQSSNWTTESGGPPYGLRKQINNIYAKGRHITDVAFDTSGRWFVGGEKRDGTGAHFWWGGTDSDADPLLRASTKSHRRVVSFAPLDGYRNDTGKYAVITGSNDYALIGVDKALANRVDRIQRKGKSIDVLRLFAIHGYGTGYFILDGEGTQWENTGVQLSKELKNGGKDPILDVAVARDGSWIVIRPNRYIASRGISSTLTAALSRFYREHQERQTGRAWEVKAHDARILRELREREAAEQRRQDEARRKAEEQRREQERAEEERRQKEKERKEKEASLKRRCEEVDRFRQIHSKRLKPMERVTAVGFSSEPGDALVKSIGGHGAIEVFKPLHQEAGSIIISDPRFLTPYHCEGDSEALTLLCYASDKYEAAVSIYHCACHDGICHCTRTLSATFLPQSILSGNDGERLLSHPPPRPVIEVTTGGNAMCFDEYKCAEKIDLSRLKAVVEDLAVDTDRRERMLSSLEKRKRNSRQDEDLKKFQRCRALEEIAKTLICRLESLPIDNNGCIIYQVDYEHRDPSGRGRLYVFPPDLPHHTSCSVIVVLSFRR
mmetsp:Transcript_13171/g.28582  ORF Transcript_13171/g.28582 Transcript_13171/m.28582 type:complete len:588 (-) Transcript_13171:241-2004(-)